jgi:dUTPase
MRIHKEKYGSARGWRQEEIVVIVTISEFFLVATGLIIQISHAVVHIIPRSTMEAATAGDLIKGPTAYIFDPPQGVGRWVV